VSALGSWKKKTISEKIQFPFYRDEKQLQNNTHYIHMISTHQHPEEQQEQQERRSKWLLFTKRELGGLW